MITNGETVLAFKRYAFTDKGDPVIKAALKRGVFTKSAPLDSKFYQRFFLDF